MSVLILSLLVISCICGSFGVIYPFQQPIVPYPDFQPAVYQFNPQAVPFNQPSVQYNPPAVNPGFSTFEPNFQISNPLQAEASQHSGNKVHISRFNNVVADFSHHFFRTLRTLPKYEHAFNLKNLSKEKAVIIYNECVRAESARAGEKDPEFSGYSASRGVKDNYDVADSTYHMKVYGFGLGEFLYQRGVLTADNAIQLSDKLLQTMKNSIDEKANPSSADNLVAIIRGCERYLTDLNSFGADASYSVVAIFSEMWYILRECV